MSYIRHSNSVITLPDCIIFEVTLVNKIGCSEIWKIHEVAKETDLLKKGSGGRW